MQASEFNNRLVRFHFILTLEGTNNSVFGNALRQPIQDKLIKFSIKERDAFGFPESIQTMFDYRNQIPLIYNRLYQLCIISLCADVEFFFRDLFSELNLEPGNGSGYFQRFSEVIMDLSCHGFDFSSISEEISQLEQAFRIRHICTHNFGFVDEKFFKSSTTPTSLGSAYIIDQNEYLRMSDAYRALLVQIDRRLSRSN